MKIREENMKYDLKQNDRVAKRKQSWSAIGAKGLLSHPPWCSKEDS